MTVRDLIDLLEKVDENLLVVSLEGEEMSSISIFKGIRGDEQLCIE